ncbi:MAG: hypothetical protein F6K18_23415 [Okeania sp. SIO2C2]|uniref:hypothetical protein n=1 Tax=Okeania sp. SIO2C2 TaxID=2607787 RepID=UPI0013B6F4A8|nr:hypothetical protein [Okeania sp. SIO2C2]NEP89542.1 hypothetical protein [Okeania sp. SIO2C2]
MAIDVENIATQHLMNPAALQLPISCPTLADVLRTRDIFFITQEESFQILKSEKFVRFIFSSSKKLEEIPQGINKKL